MHLIKTSPRKGQEARRSRETSIDASISHACVFMSEYFSTSIDVNEVCKHVGFERSYFSKVFSRKTGTTIREYLAQLRLEKAQELLLEGKLMVSEIANITGFSESRTFTHFFKKQTGSSPSHWREFNISLSK